MKNVAESNVNSLKISNDVIVKIVEIAVKSVDGVAGLKESRVSFGNMLQKTDKIPSIKIISENGSVDITVGIVVNYDFKVKQVTSDVQNKVKSDVQNMTGIPVTKINVNVSDISFGNIC